MFNKNCRECTKCIERHCMVINEIINPDTECILLSSNLDTINDRVSYAKKKIAEAESLLENNRKILAGLEEVYQLMEKRPVLPMERTINHFKPGQSVFVIHNDAWVRGTVIAVNNSVIEFSTNSGPSALTMRAPAIITEDEYIFFAKNTDYYLWWYDTAMKQLQEQREENERKYNPLKKVR